MIEQFLPSCSASRSWLQPEGLAAQVLGLASGAGSADLARALTGDDRVARALVALAARGPGSAQLDHAIEALGSSAVRVVAAALWTRLGPAEAEADGASAWDLHALACSLAARCIAQRMKGASPARMLALGLLEGVQVDDLAAWGLTSDDLAALDGARAFDLDDASRVSPVQARILRHAAILADALCLPPRGAGSDLRRIASSLDALRVVLGLDWRGFEQLVAEADTDLVQMCAVLGLAAWPRADWTNLLELVRSEMGLEPSSALGERAVSRPLRSLRILAVDDDPSSLLLLERTLRKAGHDVLTARDGGEALRIAMESHPQAVIADWMMPRMDGLELCRAMRRSELGRSVFFLLLTGRDEEDRIVEAFDAGVDDYVTKPFNPKLLQARLKGGQRVVELQERVEVNRRLLLRQVAEMGKLTRKLRNAADTDALTGLPNRRHAIWRLDNEWDLAHASGKALSVMMIDIDRFKQVNDTHGHDTGDLVLREVASILWANARQREEVSRLGGEEFFVICPGTAEAGAAIAGERLRAAVERHVIEGLGFQGRVTVSVGVAELARSMESVDALIQASDRAVYAAKASGRNQVALASRVCAARPELEGPDRP